MMAAGHIAGSPEKRQLRTGQKETHAIFLTLRTCLHVLLNLPRAALELVFSKRQYVPLCAASCLRCFSCQDFPAWFTRWYGRASPLPASASSFPCFPSSSLSSCSAFPQVHGSPDASSHSCR